MSADRARSRSTVARPIARASTRPRDTVPRRAPREVAPRDRPRARPLADRRRARSGTRPRCAGPVASDVRRTRAGAKCALSIRTSRVIRTDLRLGAAHHACDRDRALGVRDHEVVGSEHRALAVERRDLLARLRAAHPHLASRAGSSRSNACSGCPYSSRTKFVTSTTTLIARMPAASSLRHQPRRRRADAHAAHHAPDVGVAALRRRRSRSERPRTQPRAALGAARTAACAAGRRRAPAPRAPCRASTPSRRDSA